MREMVAGDFGATGAGTHVQKSQNSPAAAMQAFSFGDPEPVMDRRELLDAIECWQNGRWYEPPIAPAALTRAFRVGPHHSSAILVKRNLLAASFVPHPKLDRETFSRWALDFLVLGNGYLEARPGRLGGTARLAHALGRYVRRGVIDGEFFFVETWRTEHAFAPGRVFQLMEHDLNQEIYGVPEYLSGLQSAFLNEGATLFRRRYYLNGSHAGFIMYVSDPAQNETDIVNLREALRSSKGPGNFRNLFLYSPGGKKDGIQIIPISEVAAKDEFLGIKNTTRDDVLAAHRVPPQLLGVVPANAGGFGDVGRAADAFHRHEGVPLQRKFLALNDWLGEEVVRFEAYAPMAIGTPAKD